MTGAWKRGDRVRFVKRYELPVSPENYSVPAVLPGTQGTVVRVNAESIWVQLDGSDQSVTLWFPDAFPDELAKVNLVERLSPSRR